MMEPVRGLSWGRGGGGTIGREGISLGVPASPTHSCDTPMSVATGGCGGRVPPGSKFRGYPLETRVKEKIRNILLKVLDFLIFQK